MKLLLIDGNNLAFRCASVNSNLTHKGRNVSLVFGFYKSIIQMKKFYADYDMVVAWDCWGSKRRIAESEEAFKSGITPKPYKGSKIASDYEEKQLEKENDPFYEDMWMQMDDLKESLKFTNIFQVSKEGYEADDLIYTYVNENKKLGGTTVCISSDMDYYQMIGDGCIIYDAMKKQKWDEAQFYREFGFPISSYVDYGALAGDDSDSIVSPDGWAKGTAKKYIQNFESVDEIIKHLEAKKVKHKVLTEQLERYKLSKEPADKILKKDVKPYELKKVEKNLLEQIPRLRLAQSLKKMDIVPSTPPIRCPKGDAVKLKEFFLKNGFVTIIKEVQRLVNRESK